MTALLEMVTSQAKSFIKDNFVRDLNHHIIDGSLSKEEGNLFYTTLINESFLVYLIIALEANFTDGIVFADDKFDGFEIATERTFASVIEGCRVTDADPSPEIHSTLLFDTFGIYVVLSYQGDYDYRQQGESSWHYKIVFKSHEI